MVRSIHLREDSQGFLYDEDSGNKLQMLGPYHLDVTGIYLEDLAIEKQKRAERLILGGGGDVFFDGQAGLGRLRFRNCSCLLDGQTLAQFCGRRCIV